MAHTQLTVSDFSRTLKFENPLGNKYFATIFVTPYLGYRSRFEPIKFYTQCCSCQLIIINDICSKTWQLIVITDICSKTWQLFVVTEICSKIWQLFVINDICDKHDYTLKSVSSYYECNKITVFLRTDSYYVLMYFLRAFSFSVNHHFLLVIVTCSWLAWLVIITYLLLFIIFI